MLGTLAINKTTGGVRLLVCPSHHWHYRHLHRRYYTSALSNQIAKISQLPHMNWLRADTALHLAFNRLGQCSEPFDRVVGRATEVSVSGLIVSHAN